MVIFKVEGSVCVDAPVSEDGVNEAVAPEGSAVLTLRFTVQVPLPLNPTVI